MYMHAYINESFLAKYFISVLNSLNYVTYLGVQWDKEDY